MAAATNSDVPIYLDYNATTPVDHRVAKEMMPFLTDLTLCGNPSSAHFYGVQTRRAVEEARSRVAAMLGCHADEVIFSSGGTESNNYAIRGVLDHCARAMQRESNDGHQKSRKKRLHIVTSSVEHPSVMEVCLHVQKSGVGGAADDPNSIAVDVTMIGVDQYGMVDMKELEKVVRERQDDTVLVTIMHANNETGTVQPIAQISKLVKEINSRIVVHTDAAQSVGKVPVNVQDLAVDLLTICSHKLYGPKGVGALFVRRGVTLEKQMHGANHEMNMRPGTENVLEVVGLGKACELVQQELQSRAQHMLKLRDRLHRGLLKELDPHYDDDSSDSALLTVESRYVHLNGHPTERLPNTLYVSFPHVEANTLLSEIEHRVAASAGAACHSDDDVHVSQTLEAMKVPMDIAMGTVRLSTGMNLTEEDIDEAVTIIAQAVKKLRPALDLNEDGDHFGPDADLHGEEWEDGAACRLTSMTKGLGCGCKLRPQDLDRVLEMLPLQKANPNVLVGFNTSDDASVYKLTDEMAIVTTCDFFTPICDDPFEFGQIASANAMSDVWAMGARPIQALNLMMFPIRRLPRSVMLRILEGAQSKCQEAGVSIVGGHTIEDNEPKFGQSVTGLVHPEEVWKNRGARVGDVLVLTKPIGTGILTTGFKRKLVDEQTIAKAINVMSTLNKYAFEAIKRSGVSVHACTDITGFGLLGHLREMFQPLSQEDDASVASVNIFASKVPLIEGDELQRLASMSGVVPGGTVNNFNHTSDAVQYEESIPMSMRYILNDAQTSGGLLVAVPKDEASRLQEECSRSGVEMHVIGEVVDPTLANAGHRKKYIQVQW